MGREASATNNAWMGQTRAMQGAILVMAVLSLLAGCVQSLVLKWQNRTLVLQCVENVVGGDVLLSNCKPRHFTQAFIQTFFMFAGECIALPLYWIVERPAMKYDDVSRSIEESETVGDARPVDGPANAGRTGSLWWWTTPAPLDFLECALGCMAVTITYASTVQMLHNFMVISSAAFTMMILHYPLRVHEWLGCLIVTAALIMTSIPALTNPESATESTENMHWLGIVLAIVSTCIHSLQNIWEEALFAKRPISATYAVGIEGIAGLAISASALPIVQWTGYESPRQGWVQLGKSRSLCWGMAMYAISSLFNNVCGVAVTKWTSGLLRCLFMSVRAPMVWGLEMYFGWNTFDWCNFASMFVLVFGLAVYMFTFPFSIISNAKIRSVLMLPLDCGCSRPECDDEGHGSPSRPADHKVDIEMQTTPATVTPTHDS